LNVRIMFVCRMFDQVAGGVERMATNIMNAMAARGHDVSLFTWDLAGAEPFYPMDDSITWHRLDMGHAGQLAGNRLRARRAVEFRRLVRSAKPDVVIGFQHGPWLFAEVSLAGCDVPVILAERNAPDQYDHTRAGKIRNLIFQSMRTATAITIQSPHYVDRYPAYLRSRIVVIPNPVYPAKRFAEPGGDRAQRTLLSVGRLSYQKNYPALIAAFARLASARPDWRLRIVGEGEERSALEKLIDDTGLGDRMSMDGAVTDVASEYAAADLFCLPSRWEGFPNTLAEALAHGVPAVAFSGCAGTGDLVEHGKNGLLAVGNADTSALTASLEALMDDAGERDRMGTNARSIGTRFAPDKIYDQWERLFFRFRVCP
jgi:GalNAc-alpha-(1->4)-GalNAc-alpha-(1->3)-diNAcBac-PP-undecaprenol alpha-1,4-N-acetyl-D-galactosaminyltransferase